MAAVTRLGLYGGPRTAYAGFSPAAASVVLSGSATTADEQDIRDGGRTVILTVSNDTWVAAGATFNAARQAIIDGLDSAQSEVTGWNAEVRDKEIVTAVERTSPTIVTITLSVAAAYDITAIETITATVPAAALTNGASAIASPTFEVSAVVVALPAPTGVGGGDPSGRPRPRPPFTGRGLFPDAEPGPDDAREAPSRAPAAPPVPGEPSAPAGAAEAGLDELAAARARRERRSEEAAAEAEAERQRAEDGRRLLAFLEAEQAAFEAEQAAERQRLALLADDEAVIAAYLDAERAMREQVAIALSARRDNGLPVILRTAGIALQRALEIAGG